MNPKAPEIYAVIRRDTAAGKLNDLADGPADATDPHLTHGVRRIASYELDQDDARSATVSFYQAPSAPPAATLATATGCAKEVIAVREDCVALLLVDGVRELATRSTDQIDEPPIEAPGPGSKLSAGIVLVDEQSTLTIREPAGHYAGYEHSYPKGRIDPGETPQQTARRELLEETGLRARIVALVGDFQGQTGVTRL